LHGHTHSIHIEVIIFFVRDWFWNKKPSAFSGHTFPFDLVQHKHLVPSLPEMARAALVPVPVVASEFFRLADWAGAFQICMMPPARFVNVIFPRVLWCASRKVQL